MLGWNTGFWIIVKFDSILSLWLGKLVEEEEGNFALWFSYILTGAGANLVSWLLLPRNSVSVGASGAVFGLFAISVLVKVSQNLMSWSAIHPLRKSLTHQFFWLKMSWDWRKILEVLILGQFVIKRVSIHSSPNHILSMSEDSTVKKRACVTSVHIYASPVSLIGDGSSSSFGRFFSLFAWKLFLTEY